MDKISAFMDGESAEAETQQALKRLQTDAECKKLWDSYHLVGDIMRGEQILREDFVQRLRQRIDEEPTVLAPHARWRAANHFAFSAAAAIAGLAVVLTIAFSNNSLRPAADIATGPKIEQDKLAQAAPAERQSQPPHAANQAQVNEYLMAHQEFSPRTALQGVLPYVRSVSESHDGNRR
jgi:sigma-E factor negative regulatory protein RseA